MEGWQFDTPDPYYSQVYLAKIKFNLAGLHNYKSPTNKNFVKYIRQYHCDILRPVSTTSVEKSILYLFY